MKPILLATLEYPPQIGGIAEYLRNIVERLPAERVNVLAPAHHDARAYDAAQPVPVYRRQLLWSWVRPRWIPAAFWTDWLCRKERPGAIVVSHLLPMGRIARRQKRKRGIPYVVIVHGMDVALAMSGGARRRKEAEMALRDAALVIANSRYTASFAERFGVPKDRIMLLHPCPSFAVDTVVAPERCGGLRRDLKVCDDFLLLSVGRLVRRKGFDDVLRAVAVLKAAGTLVQYVVVGEGPERARLEALARELRVDDRVRFTGPVPHAALPEYYASCDAFVTASKSDGADVEGFGTVYLEANLFGKPVIAGRTGGVPDAVVDGVTGLLVDPGDVGQIAAAIRRLKDDAALRIALGAQGAERVRREFDWDMQARRFVRAMESVL